MHGMSEGLGAGFGCEFHLEDEVEYSSSVKRERMRIAVLATWVTRHARRWLRLAVVAILVAACSNDPRVLDGPSALDPALVAAGRTFYEQSCATCHGVDLSGDPGWKSLDANGNMRPPPQDGTGHTWHHSDQRLIEIVLNGSGAQNSDMPAFAGVLSEADVEAILEFFKSMWGPEERLFQWERTNDEGASR